MSEMIEWYPSEEDKDQIDEFCSDVIQSFQETFGEEENALEKMAFALTILTKSFEETFKIELTAIIDKEETK